MDNNIQDVSEEPINRKLPFGLKFGYGIGDIGCNYIYCYVRYVFCFFFLQTYWVWSLPWPV